MKRRDRSAPIWLFSFVDLAFLLLIALAQLLPDRKQSESPIAELELPRIESVAPGTSDRADSPRWQLRVEPVPASEGATPRRIPFALLEPGSDPTTATRVDADELAARLDQLRDRETERPLLAPHRDARAEDLLVAVSILERVWANERGVTVEPVPAVSARPDSVRSR